MAARFGGVDAGGSHTEVVILDDAGAELARGTGPAAAVAPGREAAAATTIQAVVRDAATVPLEALVVGAAGAGRPTERERLDALLVRAKLARRVRVVTDGEIALESAFPGQPGMVVIAGTGSAAFARDDSGTVRRTGGLGPALGDEGSGYALGRAAASAAARAADGRGPATALTDLIYRSARTASLDELVSWSQTASRDQVAALAALTCRAADEGDTAARELVTAAAGDLATHVVALLRQVRLPPDAPVAFGGGLLAPDSPVRTSLVTALGRVAPQLRVLATPIDPALGAARLALTLQ